MREFVGEHYLPAEAAQGAGHCAKAARAAADQLRREGTRVHHVRSILIPEDETCIHLYRAESIDAVRVAAARALLRLDRLTEAVSDTGAAVRLLLAPVVYLVGVIVLVPVSDPGSARAAQRVIAPLGSFPWPRRVRSSRSMQHSRRSLARADYAHRGVSEWYARDARSRAGQSRWSRDRRPVRRRSRSQ